MATYQEIQKGYFGNSATQYANAIKQKEASGQALSDPGAASAFKAANPGLFSSGGTGGKSGGNTMQGNVDYFGSPQAYASAINQKQATGQALSDPQSAALFQQQNPQYFPQQQVPNILERLNQKINQPVDITQTPYYQPLQDAAAQSGKLAGQQTMETMNQRGILNSTITADRVSQAQQQAMTSILPTLIEKAYGLKQDDINNLMSLLGANSDVANQQFEQAQKIQTGQMAQQAQTAEIQRQQLLAEAESEEKRIKSALSRVDSLGYVDNYSSAILGVAVGMPSFQAKKQAESMQLDLARLKNTIRQTNISAGNLSVAQQRLGLSARGQNVDDLLAVWEKTGVAPAGLEDFGVQAETPLATKTTKTNSKAISDDYIAEVIETRKMTKDARAQLESDEEQLLSIGLTPKNILYIRNYIDKWEEDDDTRTGKFYKPKK